MIITTILLSLLSIWLIRLRYLDRIAFRNMSTEYIVLQDQFLTNYEQSSKQVIAFDEHLKSIIVLYGQLISELETSNPELCSAINEGRLKIQRYREAYFDDKVEKANEFLKRAEEVKGMMK